MLRIQPKFPMHWGRVVPFWILYGFSSSMSVAAPTLDAVNQIAPCGYGIEPG
jgi:hypothetical protein